MPTLTSIDQPATPAEEPWESDLLALQLRVARRADELARTDQATGWPDIWAWIMAEGEILPAAMAVA